MMTEKTKSKDKPKDLREACVREALAVIEADGVEALSLRDVSRRLGVSHQAPYKHFPSREHILAEIATRAFDAFAAHLENRPRHDDPYADLGEMGRAYLSYARAHPLQYRLMFGGALPEADAHPEMADKARRAFALLRDAIARLPGDRAGGTGDHDALFVWSTMHGLASLFDHCAMDAPDLYGNTLETAVGETLARIGAALGQDPGDVR